MFQGRKAFLSLIVVSLLFFSVLSSASLSERWSKTTLLYEDDFESKSIDNWICELQNPEISSVESQAGKLNIDVGGGATIWFKHKLEGDIQIEYDVTIINKGGDNDRVSDLNQFWMASDPANADLFTRGGKFTEYDSLRLYYVGMGGNHNSTTRFRRYPGGGERSLLAEYTADEYLLKPHTNYHIEIICFKGRTQYRVNDKVFFDFKDAEPLTSGHFGFRTVKNHETVDNFKVYRLIASADTEKKAAPNALSSGFIHPGISHNQAELTFVKSKLKAGEQPWRESWEQMKSSKEADLTWEPKTRAHVERGAYNRPNIGASSFLDDAEAAYTHALLWVFTDNQAHALKAAEILKAWSVTLESVSNHDAKLLVGMGGLQFCNAAELLKHTWEDWPQEDQQAFKDMLQKVLYPVIQDFFPRANGNWDASMIQTMMAMGIFLDDHVMFQKAVDYYLNGTGNGAVNHYFNHYGQCQESGRDQAHTQMGLEYLVNSAEIAWKQGIDLYSAYDNRLAKGFEYTARYNLGQDVPFEYYESYQGTYKHYNISRKSRGRLRDMYEKAYNHYHNRMSMDMPWCNRAIEKTRPETGGTMPWSTLMYADQLHDLIKPAKTKNKPTNEPGGIIK